MKRSRELRKSVYFALFGNATARVAALACTVLATLVLARTGGPAVVGVYALLHVLPGLIGTIVSSGLPLAVPYFLAGPSRTERRLPLTIVAMALVAGGLGTCLWVAGAPLFGPQLFSDLSVTFVMIAGLAVLSRLLTVTAKSCSQGSGDLPGANRVIFTEQFFFLPAYGLAWGAGVDPYSGVVASLLLADAAAGSLAWGRLVRRGLFREATRPSFRLTRRMASYGLRAQIGGTISLLNLRLDFVILSLLTGPAVLGVYAVASKFAELVRILGMSLTYVLYPKFATEGLHKAAASARSLLPKAGLMSAGVVVPLWLAAGLVIPVVYGAAFEQAVAPAQIILLGLALDGVGAVILAFLYGIGRPGLNSWAMAVGLAVTVVLDFVLIPRFEMAGAAIASAIAYTTTTLTLVVFFSWVRRSERPCVLDEVRLSRADAG